MTREKAAKPISYQVGQTGAVRVEVLAAPEEVEVGHAFAALKLLDRAYSAEFEEPAGTFPKGTFNRHFDPYGDRTRGQTMHAHRKFMMAQIAKGSRYWFIPEAADPKAWIWRGLAKTSLSRANQLQKWHLVSPNCMLNDVAVDPERQGEGYATALVDAALSPFRPNRALAAAVFAGHQSVRQKLETFGLEEVPSADLAPLAVGGSGEVMPQVLYSSEGRVTIGSIRQLLAQRVTPIQPVSTVA